MGINTEAVKYPRERVGPTLALLRHFKAFLASGSFYMRDPFEVDQWGDGATRLTKIQAQLKLTWLIHMAISRKGGACLAINDSASGASLNHRGQPRRKESADYQRGLVQDAGALNRPRLIIRYLRTPELRERFAERVRSGNDA